MLLSFQQKRAAAQPEIIQLNCIDPKGDRESLVFTVKFSNTTDPTTSTATDVLSIELNTTKKGKLVNPEVIKIEGTNGVVQEAKMADGIIKSTYESIAVYKIMFEDTEFFVDAIETPEGLKPHELQIDSVSHAGTTTTMDKLATDPVVVVTYADIINVLMALFETGCIVNPDISLALSRIADGCGDTNASLYIWYDALKNTVHQQIYKGVVRKAKLMDSVAIQETANEAVIIDAVMQTEIKVATTV